MSASPLIGAKLMSGATLENLLTRNGAAGAEALVLESNTASDAAWSVKSDE